MKLKNQTRTDIIGYMFILPNLIGFLMFVAFPFIFAIVLSFHSWDGVREMKFIGLKNFASLANDAGFWISLRNTFYYAGLSVPLTLAMSIFLAFLLNGKLRLLPFYRTVFFLPCLVSVVSISVVWQAMYHPHYGPINMTLMSLGIESPPEWISSTVWAMPSIILMSIWINTGYYMVIYIAAMKNIPESLYEAARIDGASIIQQFWGVTLPMLKPTTFLVTILAIISSFKVFDQVYLLTRGGPGRATNVLVFFIYQNSFVNYKFGYASAAAFILFVLVFIITLIQYQGQKKWANDM